MISEVMEFRLGWKHGLVTSADLSVRIDGHAVWPAAGDDEAALEIQADDLLAYLTEFWSPLMLRQTYPTRVMPVRPTRLRASVEETWDQEPSEVAEDEDELVTAFEEAHDLSRCFAGIFGLPPLWMLRSGDRMLVDTRERLYRIPFGLAERELSRVGDLVAQRLIGSAPQKWSRLVEMWRSRDAADPVSLVAWSSGFDKSVARRLVDAKLIEAPPSVSAAANDNDEIRIAARMAGALPPDEIEEILRLVRSFDSRDAPRLDEAVADVSEHVVARFGDRAEFDQGEAAARRLRDRLGLRPASPVDIVSVLRDLGVAVRTEVTRSASLKALAIWGGKHGPTVLLNGPTIRAVRVEWMLTKVGQQRRFQNVTLAHELGHFLLDRGHALGAVDVLVNRMPQFVEARAKSFAGEFLLPTTTAAENWTEADRPLEPLSRYLSNLETTYGVTRSVAAWKLDHGLRRRGIEVPVYLRQIAPGM